MSDVCVCVVEGYNLRRCVNGLEMEAHLLMIFIRVLNKVQLIEAG
jgi:hypothetical protein